MRLIDADIIQGKLATLSFYTDGTFEGKIVEYVRGLIDAQPTIDAVPVVHAHWIRITRSPNEYRQCSNCHGYFTLPMPKYRGFYMRYCPNCGAKMD